MSGVTLTGNWAGIVAVLVFVIYALVKDVIPALLRRRNNNPSSDKLTAEAVQAELREHVGRAQEWHQAAVRFEEQCRGNFRDLFKRADALSREVARLTPREK